MSEEYILYDLPSKKNDACWSPNTWKARAALNFKDVSYHTEWTPYPELERKFGNEIGLKPNPEDAFARYTAPVVRFPDGSHIMESGEIARKLEELHPHPSLQLNEALQQKALEYSGQIIFPMVALIFNRVYKDIITEDEKDWFRKDRERRASQMMGREHISLEDWVKELGGVTLLDASDPGMNQLSKLLAEHKQDSGPFILGSKPCYADLIIAGLTEFYKQIGDDAFDKLIRSVDGLSELREGCRPWLERNNC